MLNMLNCVHEFETTSMVVETVYVCLPEIPGSFTGRGRSVRRRDMVLWGVEMMLRVSVYGWERSAGLATWWGCVWLNGDRG